VGIPMKIELSNFPEKWAPLIDKPVIAAELDAYADLLVTFCKAFGIRDVIDFRPDFLNPDGSVNTELFADGLHPNSAGHRLMANKVIEALNLKSTFKI